MRARLATRADANAIARIHDEAVAERSAAFDTSRGSPTEIGSWLDAGFPVIVVELTDDGEIVAFARGSSGSDNVALRGVLSFVVHTALAYRRRGAGSLAARELASRARAAGAWKLVASVLAEDDARRSLLESVGFREVGTHHRHGMLDGRWRDVVVAEKFLAPLGIDALAEGSGLGASRERIAFDLRDPDPVVRLRALDRALSSISPTSDPDRGLLAEVVDAFFVAKAHDPSARKRFVDFFRAHAALSSAAAREVYRALFARLTDWSIGTELDAFYEALYVVKLVARAPDGATPKAGAAAEGAEPPDLAPHVPLLSRWLEEAIRLPAAMRTRISAGNVTALLVTLALSGCASDAERRTIAQLAERARERHRVATPPSLLPPARALSTLPPASTPPPGSVFARSTRESMESSAGSRPPPLPPRRPPPLPERAEAEPESLLDVDVVLAPESTLELAPAAVSGTLAAHAPTAERPIGDDTSSSNDAARLPAGAVLPKKPKRKRRSTTTGKTKAKR